MKNLFKRAKYKIIKIALKKEALRRFLEDEYQRENNCYKKKIKISGLISLFSTAGLFLVCTLDSKVSDNGALALLVAGLIMSVLYSTMFFLLFNSECYFLKKRKMSKKMMVEMKIKKIKETVLNLEELGEIKPLLIKIKESLSEKEFIELIKNVEIETGKKFGNAYYFLYLINNYKKLIIKINQKQYKDDALKEQIFSLLNTDKTKEILQYREKIKI